MSTHIFLKIELVKIFTHDLIIFVHKCRTTHKRTLKNLAQGTLVKWLDFRRDWKSALKSKFTLRTPKLQFIVHINHIWGALIYCSDNFPQRNWTLCLTIISVSLKFESILIRRINYTYPLKLNYSTIFKIFGTYLPQDYYTCIQTS